MFCGKGYSQCELDEIKRFCKAKNVLMGITDQQALKTKIKYDKRRRSCHLENLENLHLYIGKNKQYQEIKKYDLFEYYAKCTANAIINGLNSVERSYLKAFDIKSNIIKENTGYDLKKHY